MPARRAVLMSWLLGASAVASGNAAAGGDLQLRIRLLEDRAELLELIARYAFHIGKGEGLLVADTFTDDGTFSAAPYEVTGIQQLRDFYSKLQPGASIPLVTNQILDIQGDIAQGKSTLLSNSRDGAEYCGYYEDTFRRVAGRWKFGHRQFTQLFRRP
jgi:hypothetical protein